MIPDSIELEGGSQRFDGFVCLVGCDKTVSGGIIAVSRLDVPAVVLSGGSMPPGRWRGHDVTIMDVYEAVGEPAIDKLSTDERDELSTVACPGAGTCAGQYTANTMGIVVDFLGLGMLGAGGIPAGAQRKVDCDRRRIDLVVDDSELDRRRAAGQRPYREPLSGVFAKDAATISSASEGAVTRPLPL